MKKKLLLLIALLLMSVAMLAACGGDGTQAITVRFIDGITKIKETPINSDGTVDKPDDLEKDGWIFDYWELDGKEFDFTENIAKSIVLRAKWSEAVTITFTGEGYAETKQIVRKGSIIIAPQPERDGYVFKGWKKAGDAEFFDFESITESAAVSAVWNIKYTLTYGGEGVETFTDSIESGGTAARPQDPVRSEDWKFEGWRAPDNAGFFDFSKPVTQNYDLAAVWTRMYLVTLKKDNGSGDETVRVEENTVIPEDKINDPARSPQSDWRFGGWRIDGGGEIFDPTTNVITGDTTLVAVWTRMYLVTVDFNNDKEPMSFRVESGTLVPADRVAGPTKNPAENWQFLGWINDELQVPFDPETEVIDGDIYLMADWVRMYLVTVDYDNGMQQASFRVPDGSFVPSEYVKTPTRGQDVFDRWIDASTLETFDPAAAPVTKDLSIKALWIRNLTVTFNNEHGAVIDIRSVYEGETLESAPEVPDTETRMFKYWVFTSGGEGVYLPDMIIEENAVITAVMADGYRVSYTAPGNIAVDIRYSDGTAVTIPRLFEAGTALRFKLDKTAEIPGGIIVKINGQIATSADGWFHITVPDAEVVIEIILDVP